MGERSSGEELLCIAMLVSCCEDDDYDDSGDGNSDVNSNVCKCGLLEGIIVTHAVFFLSCGTRGS